MRQSISSDSAGPDDLILAGDVSAGVSFIVIGLVATAIVVGAPLIGWPPVVRLSAVSVPAGVLALLYARPWRWTESTWREVEAWTPSPRAITLGALVVGALLFWLVLTRFESASISAVDFTVYFDRPCSQTVQGRPLFIETADVSQFSQRTALAIHGYWVMLPLCLVYAVWSSPLWLLAVSVVSVVAGAVHVLRITRYLGGRGVLATATALVFALNDNTARTLNYGFHAEVLYAWFVPWLLDSGLRGSRKSYVFAVAACVLVKEDACMILCAVAVILLFYKRHQMTAADWVVFILIPIAVGFASLAVYWRYIVPALLPNGPLYANFWSNYGPTPTQALLAMLLHPWSAVARTLTSGFFSTVMLPYLFLPIVGWRWTAAIAPIAIIYGASANEQLRSFGIYYSIVFVPFLVLGASVAALWLSERLERQLRHAQPAAAVILVLASLSVGLAYSLRPWRSEVRSVPNALDLLSNESLVLVHSGLYPHAGYDPRIQLLTPDSLVKPAFAGAAVLLPAINVAPFRSPELDELRHLPPISSMPPGLIAVRRPASPDN